MLCSWLPAAGGEQPDFEVRRLSVWLAQGGIDRINARDEFPSRVPWLPVTNRPRDIGNWPTAPSPLNLLTFYGQPAGPLDVTVNLPKGSFLSSWPSGNKSANRLRWLGYNLAAAKPGQLPGAVEFPANWFTPGNAENALTLRNFAGRGERFLSYDFEANWPLPVQLLGGPDTFRLRNTGNQPLYDVVVVVPLTGDKGVRIGWLDELPVAPAAEATRTVPLSAALAPGSDELSKLSSQALADRLKNAGLKREEVDFLLNYFKLAIFDTASTRVTFRLSPEAANELASVTVEPKPAKTVCVTLVIAEEMDPQSVFDIQSLVTRLGSSKYQEREAAEKHLLGLRARALPLLNEAINSLDPEIAYRAERVLTQLQEPNEKRARKSVR